MKRIVISLAFMVFACCTAAAQNKPQAQAVATCGGQSLTAGVSYPIFQDLTGTLCTPGGGGGGAVFGPTAVGSAAANPPILIGGTIDGTAAGAVSVLKVLSGIGFINCANCSGSGISVGFAGAIGSVGTPGGFKDGSGNFQPLLGDTSFGQWMNIKTSVLPTGAATQTTLASVLSALGSPFQSAGSIGNTGFSALQGGAANTVANEFFSSITDGTNKAAVKAASTAPTAADPAVVVAISNNNALTPTVSTAAEASHVIKASAGQVQGCYAVNLTSTPGFLILLNATSAPADGAVTPLGVAPLPPNGSGSISGALINALTFGTGIVAVLTSATTPFTKTTGVITGFISCQAI